MAVLHELALDGLQNPTLKNGVRALIAAEFWSWFQRNREERVTTIRVWFLSKTVRVKDLRPVFVLLFGEQT